MVVGMDDLGLSLSLPSSTHHLTPTTTAAAANNYQKKDNNMGFLMMMKNNTPTNTNIITPHHTTSPSSPLQLNLMISPFSTSTPLDRSLDTCRSHLKGITVNRSSLGGGEEEDAGVSSPKSTVSTVSGKRSSGDGDEAEVERASSRGMSDEEDGGENSRKKLRLSKDQSATLEKSFKEHSTLNPKQKQALAKRLGLRPRQVEVWFQNRRARTKLKQTEVDCEFLKGCCEKLTEENRRLQKEVHELRALKLSPQFYMHMTPPTTLTMCPSCERVAGPTPRSTPGLRPVPVNLWTGGQVTALPVVDVPQLRL